MLKISDTMLAKTGSSMVLPCGIQPPEDGEYLIQWRKKGTQKPVIVHYRYMSIISVMKRVHPLPNNKTLDLGL